MIKQFIFQSICWFKRQIQDEVSPHERYIYILKGSCLFCLSGKSIGASRPAQTVHFLLKLTTIILYRAPRPFGDTVYIRDFYFAAGCWSLHHVLFLVYLNLLASTRLGNVGFLLLHIIFSGFAKIAPWVYPLTAKQLCAHFYPYYVSSFHSHMAFELLLFVINRNHGDTVHVIIPYLPRPRLSHRTKGWVHTYLCSNTIFARLDQDLTQQRKEERWSVAHETQKPLDRFYFCQNN